MSNISRTITHDLIRGESGTLLRCAHVIASIADPGAGPSYSVRALAEAQAANGADVRILTVSGWRAAAQQSMSTPSVETIGYPWTLAWAPGVASACLSTGLQTALRHAADDLDIMHNHGLWLAPNVYPAWAVKGRRAKLVVSPRGMLGAEALEYSRLKKAIFWSAFQRPALVAANCFHATSIDEHDAIRAAGLTAPVAVIPNGVDLPPSVGSGARNTVISLGRIHPKKGLDALLHAWALVEELRPDWRLRIVGPAELGHDVELRAIAAELRLRNVSIEGPAYGADREAVYSNAALFVLPTRNENFAMTVAEALARGVPVISSKGAPWYGLVTEECGWWVDRTPQAIAAALRAAMEMDPAALTSMGARGRAWMARDFSWPRVAADMLEVYRWLARGGETPATIRFDKP